MHLAIKMNNSESNDPCGICGRRTDPDIGPELFTADGWQAVCRLCAEEHEPVLVKLMDAYRALEGAYYPWDGMSEFEAERRAIADEGNSVWF